MNTVTVALRTVGRAVRRLIWDDGTRRARGRPGTVAYILGVATRLFCAWLIAAGLFWLVVWLSRADYDKALRNAAVVVVFGGLLYLDLWQRFRKAARWPSERTGSLPSRNTPRDSG